MVIYGPQIKKKTTRTKSERDKNKNEAKNKLRPTSDFDFILLAP